jgi:type II secretory pathway pseudopilin PulG
MTLPQRSRVRRSGLSLLEVLVALSIFLAALVGLGRLIIRGSDLALEARLQSEAAELCQTKLAEVQAGAEALTPQHDMPFAESPAWRWDLECEQDNKVPNLWQVQVRVNRPPVNPGALGLEVTLSRWLLDPRSRGSVFDLAAYDSANRGISSTSSSAGNNRGGSTSGGN